MPAQTIETLAQEFFFEAMLAGYASSAKPDTHPVFPGWKQITYTKSPFTLEDSWCDEGGYTHICLTGYLVWVMRYRGSYSKEDGVIHLLKSALYESYRHKNFIGGRGPNDFTLDGTKRYVNNWRGRGFASFWGTETIFDPHRPHDEQRFGEHSYSGMLLVPPAMVITDHVVAP